MGNLIKEWIKGVLTEEIKDIVVVYAGRFQPFHKGHYTTYSHLVQKFGENNVWIGTSNKSGGPKDPFNFLEKKKIMTTMFGIPANKVVQVKNPYNPTEVLSISKSFTVEQDSNLLLGMKKMDMFTHHPHNQMR